MSKRIGIESGAKAASAKATSPLLLHNNIRLTYCPLSGIDERPADADEIRFRIGGLVGAR
jgi:hypothetical protein